MSPNRDHLPRFLGVIGGCLIASIGLALWIGWQSHTTSSVACPFSATSTVINCTAVLHSAYSLVWGIPLGWWGAGGLMVWGGFAHRRWVAHDPSRWLGAIGVVWIMIVLGGLSYAWHSEWAMGHLCIWCTALQLVFLGLVSGTVIGVIRDHRAWLRISYN